MKRSFLILYVAAALLLLSGCDANLFSSRHDMEHLRPVQTIGLDRREDRVEMSVSTGIGPSGDPPLVMAESGDGIEDAVMHLQDTSPRDELFYAHVRYLLLGAGMTADGITPVLEWIERSPTMRTDMPVFAVRGDAAEAVASSGDTTDVTMILSSLEQEERTRGQHIYTLREIATAQYERGNALCLAVELRPAQDTVEKGSDAEVSIVPTGYAVLRDGVLLAYLTEEETLGAALLAFGDSGAHVTAAGNVLSLTDGRAKASGQWENGTLTGIRIECRLQAGILERLPEGETDAERIETALAETAAGWLRAVAERSQALGCDFLDLKTAAQKTAPGNQPPADWETLFPTLPVTVSVTAHLDNSYDLSGESGAVA